MKNPLSNTSILLDLEICKWTGEVSDKKGLAAVAAAYQSDTRLDKYKKSLFVVDALALVDRAAGRIRNHFYACTVPWLDNGNGRLIPSMSFQDFATKHSQLKHEFNHEVAEFIKQYPDHKEMAKQHKGDMYMEHEYPDVTALPALFSINLSALPFPSIDDFRVSAPANVIQELKTTMEESLARVEDVVTKEFAKRLQTRLQMLRKTLTVGQRFSTSLLTELAALISMARNLRDTISEDLDKKMVIIEDQILIHDADAIRDSVSLQQSLIEVCDKLLKS